MNDIYELVETCQFIINVANAEIPSRLKYELSANARAHLRLRLSLGELYDLDEDWEGLEEEVQEYAEIARRLKADLEKISFYGF